MAQCLILFLGLRSIIPRRRGNDFILAQDGLLLEIEHKWALNFFERMARGLLLKKSLWL
jgi:hypothetical protein